MKTPIGIWNDFKLREKVEPILNEIESEVNAFLKKQNDWILVGIGLLPAPGLLETGEVIMRFYVHHQGKIIGTSFAWAEDVEKYWNYWLNLLKTNSIEDFTKKFLTVKEHEGEKYKKE